MALLFWEGFDRFKETDEDHPHGILEELFFEHSNSGATEAQIGVEPGRFGGQGLSFPTTGTIPRWVRHRLKIGPQANVTIGFALYVGANLSGHGGGDGEFFRFEETTLGTQFNEIVHITLSVSTTGAITAWRGAKTTNLGSTAAGVIDATNAGWYYFELSVNFNNATGSISLLKDSVSVLSLSGIDTITGAGSGTNQFLLGTNWSNARPMFIFDDLYLIDSLTPLGPCQVETLYPNSDSSVAWTRSAGSDNYANVDDLQTEADYNYSSTNAQKDEFGLPNLMNNANTIHAVKVFSLFGMPIGGPEPLRNHILSGATQGNGAEKSSVSQDLIAWSQDEFLVDPATSAAWTTAGVNALKSGYTRKP